MVWTNGWTEAEVREAKRLWDAGETSRIIAGRLGRSRNAVIGLAHRRNWKGRRASAPPRTVQTPVVEPHARSCQYPYGDPKDPGFRFCGEKARPGKPYCAEHCAVCYRRPEEVA